MKRTLITLVAAAALLAPAAPSQADPMPVDQAAARYLQLICPANKAAARFERAMNRYDGRDSYGDRVHSKTRAAARKVSSKATWSARHMMDPAFPWPVEVADEIVTVAEGNYDIAATFKRISRPKHRWGPDDFDYPDPSAEVATIRLHLGLPPDGGC